MEEKARGGLVPWIIAGIVILMLGGLAATIAISVQNDVSGGYIAPDQR